MVKPITIATAFLSVLPLGVGCSNDKAQDKIVVKAEIERKPVEDKKLRTINQDFLELSELYKLLPELPVLFIGCEKDEANTNKVTIGFLDPEHIDSMLQKQNLDASSRRFIISTLMKSAKKDVDFIYSREKAGLLTVINPKDLRNEPPVKLTDPSPQSIKNSFLYRYGFPIFINSVDINTTHGANGPKIFAETATIRKYVDENGLQKDGIALEVISLKDKTIERELRILPIDVPIFIIDCLPGNPPAPFTVNFIDTGNRFDPQERKKDNSIPQATHFYKNSFTLI